MMVGDIQIFAGAIVGLTLTPRLIFAWLLALNPNASECKPVKFTRAQSMTWAAGWACFLSGVLQ